ncbi:KTSC domain-containing protein [Paenibacillus naphthalenovorans]|uniref:KTSC domain-containing protein n=1 Tax=Paenibacillus naphthalenovorans TaxID=162209 RepID=UPI000885E899|nr:KTSC domain-containing protein [Paenibacillus naphthalenovorans]SDJ74922.1 KTSC domain-containing protein [Paenibacillus naphthalenovorans]
MKLLPIGSKQIAFVSYDDQSSQMHIQYHTGQTLTCSGIKPEQYQLLLQSPNRYDMIMKLTYEQSFLPPRIQ